MEPLRLGVIGTGSVVREIYRYLYFDSGYRDLVEVVAACDTQPDALEAFCESHGIPASRRYDDYRKLIEGSELDVVAVNTPDSLHREPACAAMEAGLDVLVPKPTAATVADAHAMLDTARRTERYFGVDYHKRSDPVVREAAARYRAGEYGTLQIGTFYMLDKLLVSDPNHRPRFFASADFAERNSPVSFLTSHMADTFMTITGLYPVTVRATGYRQKLRSLEPIRIDGFDTVDTVVVFENGATVHIITGWILPNPATCITVQSGRLLFTDAAVDLWNESYGYHELTSEGLSHRNVLFRNFEADGTVSGYGISNPGEILRRIAAYRRNRESWPEDEVGSPFLSGLLTTLVCECAVTSLQRGEEDGHGVVHGVTVDSCETLREAVGEKAADTYLRGNRDR